MSWFLSKKTFLSFLIRMFFVLYQLKNRIVFGLKKTDIIISDVRRALIVLPNRSKGVIMKLIKRVNLL